jgi:hypothetical protein
MRCAGRGGVARRGNQSKKVQQFKARFSKASTESLILRLQRKNLVVEAEIAARELLQERGVPDERIPIQGEMDPQTKLFWDLIPLLRTHGLDEANIALLGFFTGFTRSDMLRAWGQVILRLQRLHSPLAPELQQALDRCMSEVRKVCPDIKEDDPPAG